MGLEADGSEGQSKLFKETNKVYQVSEGTIEFAVNRVDSETGEFSGVFVSEQVRPVLGGVPSGVKNLHSSAILKRGKSVPVGYACKHSELIWLIMVPLSQALT